MIKIGICNAEIAIHNQVKKIIFANSFETKVELICFMSGKELLEYNGNIDILLFDISMLGKEGIRKEVFKKRYISIGKIIVLTDLVERFQEAFEIGAYRFITNDTIDERLIKAIKEAMATFIGNAIVEVYLESAKYNFEQREITYISKNQSRTEVIVANIVFHSIHTLLEWKQILDNRLFSDT